MTEFVINLFAGGGGASVGIEVALGRAVMGMPGCRDTAPGLNCDAFTPGEPGNGECDTDGHYMCAECSEMSLTELRRRKEDDDA